MVLVVDIGNTNIKVGVFEGSDMLFSGRFTSSSLTSDEYYVALKDLFELRKIDIASVKGVIMSSVNPNLNYTFEHLIKDYFHVNPMIVGQGIKTGLNIKYDNPKEVGADRIVNSVAAYKTYGGPCIVLDCGTATTFNVISASGEFLGGCISFGLKTGADALCAKAAKLPKIELSRPDNIIGKSTITNMQAGLLYGYTGMIEYIIKKIKEELGCDAKVIATGGLSELVSKEGGCITRIDRSLTLRGLNIIYQMNIKPDSNLADKK